MKIDADRPTTGRMTLRLLVAIAAGGALAAALQPGPAARATTTPAPQRLTIVIRPAAHGRENVPEPNIAIRPGIPVTLRLVNESREPHTFTMPMLGVNSIVLPGSPQKPRVATITFTAQDFGVFRWHCELCPQAHHKGPMGGKVYAIIGA